MSEAEAHWMRRALEAARRAEGFTSPNPAVGCALVQGAELVGLGWHERAGAPHAEVVALQQAGARAAGATAYVTLEPCNHHGRTGPCTEALIGAGVARVRIGALDPNPGVAGGGAARLREAGLEVDRGALQAECEALIAPFRRAVLEGLPWVRLKLAATLDGRVADADGERAWVTGPAARRHVARQRERSDAILVGVGTVLADDPRLDARPPGRARCRQPVPAVLDTHLRAPVRAHVIRPGAILLTSEAALRSAERDGRADALRANGARLEAVETREGRVDARAALAALARAGVHRVYAEGGPRVAATLLRDGLVQRVDWFAAAALAGAPHVSGLPESIGVARLAEARRGRVVGWRRFGDDVCCEVAL